MIYIKRIICAIIALSLCLALAACGGTSGTSAQGGGSAQVQEPAAPVNPMTGAEVSEDKAVLRPLAVAVNNKEAAWPQRGTDAADAVIEMQTENQNTHLLLLYGDYTAIPQIGPVTEICDAQAQCAVGLNAITAYIGATVYADNLFNQYEYMTIDGKYLGKVAFAFDDGRALVRNNEYSRFTNGELIAAAIENRQIETTATPVKLLNFIEPDEPELALTEGDAPDVGFNFTDNNYTQLTYNADTGLYQKQQFNAPVSDELDGAQLAYKNVVVLVAPQEVKADGFSYGYNFASGTGYYICGGKYQSISYTKTGPESNFIITDANGAELAANIGKTYIAVLTPERAAALKMDVNAPEVPAEGAESGVTDAASIPADTASTPAEETPDAASTPAEEAPAESTPAQ